jgi:hypothetical protein
VEPTAPHAFDAMITVLHRHGLDAAARIDELVEQPSTKFHS